MHLLPTACARNALRRQDGLAEWSKALASGASPQGRGLEPHSRHFDDANLGDAACSVSAATSCRSACSVAVSYKPPMLVTRAQLPACAYYFPSSLRASLGFPALSSPSRALPSRGTWSSGITSVSHAEGSGLKSQCVHVCRARSWRKDHIDFFLPCCWSCWEEQDHHWPRGPMDKASAYGAGDCRLESCRGHFFTQSHLRTSVTAKINTPSQDRTGHLQRVRLTS